MSVVQSTVLICCCAAVCRSVLVLILLCDAKSVCVVLSRVGRGLCPHELHMSSQSDRGSYDSR